MPDTTAEAAPTAADEAVARITGFLRALHAHNEGRTRSEFEPRGIAGIPGPDGAYHELLTEDLETVLAELLTVFVHAAGRRDELAAIAQQLGVIFQMQPQCAICAAEARQGQRPNINFVNVIVDGTGYCNDHVDIVNGRLRPRATSGLIIGGAH